MARMDINRSGEMEVFVRAVDLGGFSAAARALRMTPSAVSKLIARLEARLGARLVNRSTRKLQLTPEGAAFYDRALRILADLDEAERNATSGATPRGRLRVNTSVPFGTHRLIPLLPDFLERHPEVTVEVTLTDAVVDLLEARADVAIRVGPLKSSQLVARKLGESRMMLVAAPSYLNRRGMPQSPENLARHNLLGFSFARQSNGWPFQDGNGHASAVVPTGNAQVSDGESMRLLVLAGLGISRLSLFHVGPDVAAGRLVPVLEAYNPGDTESIHAVYVGGGPLPARVRAFLDYLVETVRLS
ncbi:LysR family transcriptional regulator [Microvirga sp. Mcv34]|uniref:LysR family transcriptional regulator n=1 Tax=Microvirga sp. Mcv34 TaxID=2926016 RepID=UPI0021C66A65|nr:LysR family transcriptional regulator [Microvirga sp. Mcv34]